ncbi:MAG: hypothetical protein RLZZ350_1681 [Verrucomicrobiota bacterium]|jgi:hypothetical protein
MTAVAETNWSRLRWLGVVALIFAGQLAFIWLLGARQPNTPRRAWTAPETLLVADVPFPLAEFSDPTLFVLPHTQSFSGQARTLTPRPQFTSAGWDEPFRWLPVNEEKLGQSFRQLLADNTASEHGVAEKFSPAPTLLAIPAAPAPANPPAAVRVTGVLANRALLAVPELPAQTTADNLPDTTAQVLVDAAGRVVTATIISAHTAADADALTLARQLQFTALSGGDNSRVTRPLEGLTSGQIIFHWPTLPLPEK